MRMRDVRVCIIGCIAIGVMFTGQIAHAVTLDEELYDIDKLRAGFDTPFEEVERRCAELLERYKDPSEQGKIYFELAQVEGQSGLQHPQKLIKYINEALARPLDPVKRVRLYIYWGDVIQVSHGGVRGRELATVRRKAVMPYLNGLKEQLEYDLPEVEPEIPGIRVFNYDGPKDTKEYQDLVRERQKQIKAREEAIFQRDMIEHRDVLTSQISLMYSRLPFATDELESLAKDVLKDDAAVDRLMARVQERIQKRLEAMGGGIPKELPEDLDTVRSPSATATSGDPSRQDHPGDGKTEAPKRQEAQNPGTTGTSSQSGNPALLVVVAVVVVGTLVGAVVWRRGRTQR